MPRPISHMFYIRTYKIYSNPKPLGLDIMFVASSSETTKFVQIMPLGAKNGPAAEVTFFA